MKTKIYTTISIFMLISICSFAQDTAERVIKGTVTTAADGGALVGANIILKNTTTGVATDKDGKFTFPIKLKVGDVLIFSYVGCTPVSYPIAANGENDISVALSVDSLMIESGNDGAYTTKSQAKRKNRK